MMNQQETSQCQNCKSEFTIEPEDFAFYAKMEVPAPTWCPECRLIRRNLFNNERFYYRRQCDLCGKNIVALYPADSEYTVYCQKCWWSDKWDPYEYGKDYDPDKSFFEQFAALSKRVPVIALMNDDGISSENCEYTHNFSFGKNCYLVVAAWYVENGLYSYHTNYVKDAVDCLQVFNSEFIYQSFNLSKCSRCFFCAQCEECLNCWFSFDLKNCSDCILSVGLRNKKYCIRNKQYTPEEYAKAVRKLGLESRKGIELLKKELHELKEKYPHRYANIVKSVNSSGDGLRSCKNANDCFWFNDLEDCRFMVNGDGGKDTYDCNHVGKPSFCYEGLTCDESYRAIATVNCWKCQDVLYSNNCHSSRNLFGCLAIRRGSYAVLNKKYSKEDYERLKTEIIGQMRVRHEWSEFFPPSMAPFAYNETSAEELQPLNKREALANGYRWRDQDAKSHAISKIPEELPDRIVDTDDAILKETIGCAHKRVATTGARTSTIKANVPRLTPVNRLNSVAGRPAND